MKQRKIKDLTLDELKQVFKVNTKLQQDVCEDLQNTADFWVSEYLNMFPSNSIDYSISGNACCDYFAVRTNQAEKFLQGLENLQKAYDFLRDKFNPTINLAKIVVRAYNYEAAGLDDFTFEALEKLVDACVNKLEVACLKRLNQEYNYDYNDTLAHFLDFYVELLENDNFYIDENFVLYENVAFTRCYK